MSDIQEQTDRPLGEELDDFDVEGHGLREVALGLSAATVVATGAGVAAIAMDNPLPGTTSGINAAVTGVSNDVQDTSAWTLATADGVASSTVDQANRAVHGASTIVVSTATPVLGTTSSTIDAATTLADDTVKSAAALAKEAVADPFGTTDRAVDGALTTTRETRDDALTVTSDALKLAGKTAESASTSATTTAGDAIQHVDPSADVDMQEDGTTVTAGAAGKTVTVSTR